MALDEKPLRQGVVLTSGELYFLISARLGHEQYKHIAHVLFHKQQVKRLFRVLIDVGQGHVNQE